MLNSFCISGVKPTISIWIIFFFVFDAGCKHFNDNLWFFVHLWYWSGISYIVAIVFLIPSFLILLNNWRRIDISSLKIQEEFCSESIWALNFLGGEVFYFIFVVTLRVLITSSISVLMIDLCKVFMLVCSNFFRVWELRNTNISFYYFYFSKLDYDFKMCPSDSFYFMVYFAMSQTIIQEY